jgi:hypothetical protein
VGENPIGAVVVRKLIWVTNNEQSSNHATGTEVYADVDGTGDVVLSLTNAVNAMRRLTKTEEVTP